MAARRRPWRSRDKTVQCLPSIDKKVATPKAGFGIVETLEADSVPLDVQSSGDVPQTYPTQPESQYPVATLKARGHEP